MEEKLITFVGGVWTAMTTPAVAIADDATAVLHAQPGQEPTAYGAVVRVLNPRLHTNQSVDCASCHIAPDIAIFVGTTRMLSVANYPDRFQSAESLDAVPKDPGEATRFQNIHMISYSGRTFSLASRTAVLEQLNAP